MKKISYLISCILCILMLTSCGNINEALIQDNAKTPIYEYTGEYLYIDKDYNLCRYNEKEKTKSIIDTNVLNYKSNSDYIVYIKAENNQNSIYIHDFVKDTKNKVTEVFNPELLLDDTNLYFVLNNKLIEYSIMNNKVNREFNLTTDDIVLHDIKDNLIAFSYMKNNTPTISTLDINSGEEEKVLEKCSNIFFNNGYIYGINSDNLIVRTRQGEDETIVNNLEVIKFKMTSDYIVYIDVRGRLNSLDMDGTNKVVSENAIDFDIIDNKIIYLTNNDVIYETQLNAKHKSIFITDSINTLNINRI